MVRKSWIWRDFSITVKIFFDIFLIKTFPDWCDKSHLFFCLVKHLANIRKWLTLFSFYSYFRYTMICYLIFDILIHNYICRSYSAKIRDFLQKKFCFQEERCNVENDGPRSLSKNIFIHIFYWKYLCHIVIECTCDFPKVKSEITKVFCIEWLYFFIFFIVCPTIFTLPI